MCPLNAETNWVLIEKIQLMELIINQFNFFHCRANEKYLITRNLTS